MAEVTMEEMEEQAAANETKAPTKASDIKLDASDVPDEYKGKDAGALMEQNRRLAESLKISEDARLALRNSAERVPDRREEVVEDPDEKVTREEFEELLKNEPYKALQIYDRRLTKRLAAHFEERFKPLVDGGVSSQEARAREKYAVEFELFGEQIERVKAQTKPGILSTEAGWKDLIAYVRGQDDNIDKIIARKTSKPASRAREEQIEDAGFTPRATARREAPVSMDELGLDEVQRKIAENQFPELSKQKAWAEYKKWSMA